LFSLKIGSFPAKHKANNFSLNEKQKCKTKKERKRNISWINSGTKSRTENRNKNDKQISRKFYPNNNFITGKKRSFLDKYKLSDKLVDK
jgi:hypothetical protein